MPFKRLAKRIRITNRRRLAVCALLCLFSGLSALAAPSFAQNKILGAAVLNDETDRLDLGPYALVQEDAEGKITPQSIVASNGVVLAGKLSKHDMLSLGFQGTPVWVSLKLLNQSRQTDWIMDLGRRYEGRIGRLKSVHVYALTIAGAGDPAAAPGTVSLSELKPQSGGVYKITLGRGEERLILFDIKPGAGLPAVVPLRIYTESAFLGHIQNRATIHTFYCLLLFGLGLYFINLSFLRKKRSQAVYGAYFFFAAIIWITYDSLGSHAGSGLMGTFILVMMLGYALLSLAMTKVFCGIEYGSFTEKYILYGLAWLNIVCTALLFLLPVGDGISYMCLLYGAPILTMFVISLMSFAQVRQGQLPGNLFLYSWLFPFGGYIITTLSACRILPQNVYLLNAFWILLPVQGFFLIRAVAQRLAGMLDMEPASRSGFMDGLNLNRLKETKDTADHTRLLKVIEKEREMLAEFRMKEASRTEEMRKAKEMADEANRAKSAFLAVVSHEIRTPMTGIMGMVRLLLDSNISKQQKDYVLTIQESSEAMLALLNDILDFEKIQRGKIELENISFDLHRLIQGVVTLMSGHAAEKQVSLSARLGDDVPRFVKGDPTRLRQVLLNLMGNAIKFTERGSVTLFVKNLNPEQSSGAPSDKYMVYFAVQDSGIGIPLEAQKNLFNPFSQANTSISRRFGGSGLGLAISKGLIENMNSSININSKEGEGSTFFFTLEMEKGLAIAQEQSRKNTGDGAPYQPAAPLKIMIVDDNAINRKVAAGFLQEGRHDIVTCGTGEEALNRIDRDAFDLILMDIELPGMRGNEVTRILRDHADPVKSKLPVIAMTGNISREDMERYLADGMTGFIAKPIDPDKLRAIVAEISHKTYERELKAPGSVAPPPPLPPQSPEPEPAPKQAVNYDGVFNPDMLQSLKDTIGAAPLNELLHDLIVKTEEILASMDLAVQSGDMESLAARAHELKGMAGNFGLVEISSIAAQAEKKAKTKETDGLHSLVDSLPGANVRAQDALREWVSH